ncbi:MAG: hypothetical protein V2I33_25115 [Kangiellaceae bacterium]|jgi:hypothetical protein|nr:hypothetical protein [Kangiellaceae bacterium]
MIEFAINIYNLQGLVDMGSIQWLLPEIEDTATVTKHIAKILKSPPTNVSSPDMEYFKMILVLSK